MSRKQRPDPEPEILLPDRRALVHRANEALDHNHYVNKVRRRGENPISDSWLVLMDELRRRLAECRECEVGIDEALLLYMIQHCDMTATSPKRDDNDEPIVMHGCQVLILRRVGCRVRMKQEEIARALGRSRQHVNTQIAKLREWHFIVNWGKGWNEFDASLCWRGDLDVYNVYAEQQRVRN